MYGKIFESIYDGTLAENWQALVTFQQLIILCGADGVIDMTSTALSRRTGVPLEIIEAGIAALESPDPYSRTPDDEGRRIRRLDEHRPWGWYIVNHQKYRAIQSSETIRLQNRERKRRQRGQAAQDGHEPSPGVTMDGVESRSVTPGHAPSRMSRHTDTNTDTKTPSPPLAGCDLFQLFWTQYPKQEDQGDAKREWVKLSADDELLEAILAGLRRAKTSPQWCRVDENGKAGRWISKPARFLRKRQWENVWTVQIKRSGSSNLANPKETAHAPLTDEARAVGREEMGRAKEVVLKGNKSTKQPIAAKVLP